MLYNNGYIIKGLYEHADYSQKWDSYFGIGSFVSWPLKFHSGFEAMERRMEELYLTADNGFFLDSSYFDGFPRTLEFIRNEDFINEYVEICKSQKIKTIIMKIESEIPTSGLCSTFQTVQVLGWDCIAQSYYSYLPDMDFLNNCDYLKRKLNCNKLFDSILDLKEFMQIRHNEMLNGAELENSFEPIPGRISIVTN